MSLTNPRLMRFSDNEKSLPAIGRRELFQVSLFPATRQLTAAAAAAAVSEQVGKRNGAESPARTMGLISAHLFL